MDYAPKLKKLVYENWHPSQNKTADLTGLQAIRNASRFGKSFAREDTTWEITLDKKLKAELEKTGMVPVSKSEKPQGQGRD